MNFFTNRKDANIRKNKGAEPPALRGDAVPYPTSDLVIWREFKGGSEVAFNYIYREYFDTLFGYALQFTHDQELIKDLIQDFFIDLREKRERLGDTDSIKYYLFKSLRRKITRYLSKNKVLLTSSELSQTFQVVLSHEAILINQQLTQEKSDQLQEAFAKLSPKKREAIYHVFYENLSYKETASIMGLMNVKSVRNLIYKALDNLRKNIKDCY